MWEPSLLAIAIQAAKKNQLISLINLWFDVFLPLIGKERNLLNEF
jgi:hypothetical protein